VTTKALTVASVKSNLLVWKGYSSCLLGVLAAGTPPEALNEQQKSPK